MIKEFHIANRVNLYDSLHPNSLLILFSGVEVRKTNDEYYPFFADRNFVYLTGIEQKESILVAEKSSSGTVSERLYILPGDLLAERWTGRRLTPYEAEALSGIKDIRPVGLFADEIHKLTTSGRFASLYLDLFRQSPADIDRPAHFFLRKAQSEYPYLTVQNANALIRKLRTCKHPDEIAAMREAEKITGEGILAMMKASRPGMYEYQYKAEFDYVLGQHGPTGPGFPSIISAGANNFCIHYYAYTGQAHDGDMILNDVGAQFDNHITDVSRGWPCNGRFSERQKLLYECALETSNYMFTIVRPGMKMADVDKTVHQYNAELLKDAGVLDSVENVSKYMWHGGAHHVGYDVHDAIEAPEVISPNMIFCIDVGIYHEEWGIGFRLEDNCLVTETGCENLSASIPRTIEDIEDVMRK